MLAHLLSSNTKSPNQQNVQNVEEEFSTQHSVFNFQFIFLPIKLLINDGAVPVTTMTFNIFMCGVEL